MLEDGKATYYGQNPEQADTFVGRIETEYGIKEGVFTHDQESVGKIILHGYGRFFYPSYTKEAVFDHGKIVIEVLCETPAIPDSRLRAAELI